MNEFIAPKKLFVDATQYINCMLQQGRLEKDLHDDEEICPWCLGVGLAIANNPYGLSGDPNRRSGMFPYKHQAFTFCQHCFNGVIHRCKLCGEIMPKGHLKHDCEQQRKLDCQEIEEKDRQALEVAKEYPPEALYDFVMCYYDGYPFDNGYFMDWEGFFDWWYSECEGQMPRPACVWSTERIEMSINARNIVEDAISDLYDGAHESISDASIDKLQEFLHDWCKTCGVGDTFMQSQKGKVRIPWEQYDAKG